MYPLFILNPNGFKKLSDMESLVKLYFWFIYLASMEAMNSQNVLEDV